MLIKSIGVLLAAAAFAPLSACASPCEPPGRLCASETANTSAGAQTHPLAESVVAAPVVAPAKAEPKRIALLLPLRSENLGPPADALRAGFMAAWERDREGFTVNVIEAGDTTQETLDLYRAAAANNDIVVGPLARSAVSALAASDLVSKPTIALNHPDRRDLTLPRQMIVIGLSIEDEARQVANWAANDQPAGSALIVSGMNAWQRRIASAYAGVWKQLGRKAQLVELPDSNGYLSQSAIAQLKSRIDSEPPALLLAALDADQLSQVRAGVGTELPVYATSSANPVSEPGVALTELDGLRMLDLPWTVQPDHSAVMVYPKRVGATRSLDLDRLYGLGIDAYRLAREVVLHPGADVSIDGVTGKLTLRFTQGPPRFERSEAAVVYQGGSFKSAGP